MSGARFAKGPWEYNDPAKFTQGHGTFSETAVYAPGNAFPWRMCEVQGPNLETEIATARLIAAAPELYEALEDAVAYLSELPHEPAVKIASALAKARGE